MLSSTKKALAASILSAVYCARTGLAAAEEIVVIVNPRNTTVSVTADQVVQIFFGKTVALAGGNANPIDEIAGSPVRDEFYQKVAGKTSAQVKAIWARLFFSGRGAPPKALKTSADVKKLVASDPNAIGYIEKSQVDASVKVVLTLP